ncbi:MAG: N-acyl homoserine lactonase family protein [Acidimicrobiales bacterium]
MPLPAVPVIDRLTLAVVTAVPQWHPEHDGFQPFPVHGWVVRHPDGILLVDTGIGTGNSFIQELYQPEVVPLPKALGTVGLTCDDITAVIVSHLHFDHCGQLGLLTTPVYIQAEEQMAAQTDGYTVPEWAHVPNDRLRLVRGDEQIAEGVRLLPTPGHTPGHQSVVIDAPGIRVVLAAQCAFRADELRSTQPAASNLHDETWADAALDSLQRLRGLAPFAAHLSHDPEIVNLGP